MRLISAGAINFGSYKSVNFSFENQGLALISGATGSGKSTLCDLVPWILFGKTAKGGNADEIKSWSSQEDTYGFIELMNSYGEFIYITRIRGAKKNDLCFRRESELNSIEHHAKGSRGKDLNDTQKQINHILGLDYDLYMSSSYFHEFSASASFFATNAKNRRYLTEQFVDLTLPTTLSDNFSEYKKDLKKVLIELEQSLQLKQNDLAHSHKQLKMLNIRERDFLIAKLEKLNKFKELSKNFEDNKKKVIQKLEYDIDTKTIELTQEIEDIDKLLKPDDYYVKIKADIESKKAALGDAVCKECGAARKHVNHMMLDKQYYKLEVEERENISRQSRFVVLHDKLEKHLNSAKSLIAAESSKINIYDEQREELARQISPFIADIESEQLVGFHLEDAIEDLNKELDALKLELSDIELLLEVNAKLRMTLIERAVNELESSTNKLLNDHFDAELRVAFSAEDADKLTVDIFKDGNQCVYTQLSKGQRQLLKLCFSVSVMKQVTNHSGVSVNTLFLDEFADGLDEQLKIQAYGLLEELALSYESVLAIDHNETLKSMFRKRYEVTLVNGGSQIEEQI